MADLDRLRGVLLGAAIGDALGMPIESLSHQNVRTYYRGIKDFRADEKRKDLGEGQWTGRTQALIALAETLADGERPAGTFLKAPDLRHLRRASERIAPGIVISAGSAIGMAWYAHDWQQELAQAVVQESLAEWCGEADTSAAAFGQAAAVRELLSNDAGSLEGARWFEGVWQAVLWGEDRFGASGSVSSRLSHLRNHLDSFPLDLQDAAGGTGAPPDEAWPFAVAMLARNPMLIDASLLSAINVGGDAPTIGACLGAMLGALHGVSELPASWRERVEARSRLEEVADRFVDEAVES